MTTRTYPFPIYYADYIELPLPEGHRFPADKYRKTRTALINELGLSESNFQESPLATKEELLTTHDPYYVDAIFQGTLPERAQKRIGFPWSPDFVRRSLASTGGTLAASRQALTHGYGVQLAGGTHHAHHDFGAGFCVFNDFAVSANVLLNEGKVSRVAVVDLDVHQGDGNASLFATNPDVLVVSLHGEKNFPSRKFVSDLDIALPDHCEDDEYLDALTNALILVERFVPDLILYQAGVDGLKSDRLGRLSLTHEGLIQRDYQVFQLAQRHGIPIVQVLGGGYSDPIEPTVQAYVNTFSVALSYQDQ